MLKYDINAFVLVEEVVGQSLAQIVTGLAVLPRIAHVRALYWAGRLGEKRDFKLADAGKEIQERLSGGATLSNIVDEICTAIDASGIYDKSEQQEEDSDPQNSPASQ